MQIPVLFTQRKVVSSVPRPQTAQIYGSYSFDARIKILTAMNFSYPF